MAITQAIKEVSRGGLCSDRVYYEGYDDLLVLSLGTGNQVHGYGAEEVSKWGVLDWMVHDGEAPLVDMVFNASSDMVDYNLSIIFESQDSSKNYLRITTDSLEGSALSLDDSSKANLERLVQIAQSLLDEPVAERDFHTGDLVPVPTGETNREALRRFAQFLSHERKARFAAESTSPQRQHTSQRKPKQPPQPAPDPATSMELVQVERQDRAYATFPYSPSLKLFDNPFEATHSSPGAPWAAPQAVSYVEPVYSTYSYQQPEPECSRRSRGQSSFSGSSPWSYSDHQNSDHGSLVYYDNSHQVRSYSSQPTYSRHYNDYFGIFN